MNTSNLFAALWVLSIAPLMAETPTYTAVEAAKHVGETASVTDKVDRVSRRRAETFF
jgi:hypothetical protein